ncbi:hypothetical protein Tco_0299616 [Tanacetum coccineum]
MVSFYSSDIVSCAMVSLRSQTFSASCSATSRNMMEILCLLRGTIGVALVAVLVQLHYVVMHLTNQLWKLLLELSRECIDGNYEVKMIEGSLSDVL